jgi:tetratricopeptide (TPR) repeat protein
MGLQKGQTLLSPLSLIRLVGGVEIIPPAKVSAKDEGHNRSRPRYQYPLKVFAVIFALVGLLLGGGLLFHYLSKNLVHMAEAPDENAVLAPKKANVTGELPTGGVVPELVQTADPEQLALEKESAEQKLADFLHGKKELDEKGGKEWGGDLYAGMIQLGQEADALFINKEYSSASNKYEEALTKANELAGQTDDVLARLMEEGRIALSEGDAERAQQNFSMALMIDPANEFAHRNLERAKKIEAVLQLIDSAKRYEKTNNLSFALTDYQEALGLDPESDHARKGFRRVKGLIAGEQFQQFMSSGFAALHKSEYEVARAGFLEAQSFKPDSREVQDALAQVDQAIRLARIEALREKALTAEQSEDWQRALESYVAVLEMDAAIQFAARGKVRSLEQIRITKRINFYLMKPGVLESDRHLENALFLLHEALETEPKGPRLTAQVKKFDKLVRVAQTPVNVTLESDNLTEVAVYKVGKLGRFYTRDLDLRPGTYTVVGTRNGYKDVRQKIAVKAGKNQVRITVKCREMI